MLVVPEISKTDLMMTEALLPIRHPQADLFICDILDAVPKSDMASMEHPIFTLSTKPDTTIRYYEHNSNSIKISPSVEGIATIHDKDILIYCISQLMAGINEGREPSRTIHLKAYDLLVTTNRQTNGQGYMLLKKAFERLSGTRITTDIETGGERQISGFGIIDAWEIIAKDKKSDRMVEISVTLSKWMYASVLSKEVLTINRDYFRLRKPLERRVYEIARKHCGNKNKWKIGIRLLQKKCGSAGSLRKFRYMLNNIVEHNHLPDYTVHLEEGNVTFSLREEDPQTDIFSFQKKGYPVLKTDTFQKAKNVAPGMDVYYLQEEWHDYWDQTGRPVLTSPDGAFIAFCKQRYNKEQQTTLF